MTQQKQAIIAGVSSDIGIALAQSWIAEGWRLAGTFRTLSPQVDALSSGFDALLPCDFSDNTSIDACAAEIRKNHFKWDACVLCPGTMAPIGAFIDCNADDYEKNLAVNLLGPLRLLNKVLALRRPADGWSLPFVLFFAGGGTNSAPANYSAYTISKIALIKAVELLDAEMPDVRFCILGPGWVKTKIHRETLDAGDVTSAGAASRTKEHLKNGDFVDIKHVVSCCQWLYLSSKLVTGGRNFSAAHDFKDHQRLENELRADPNMFKLRRAGNDRLL